MFIVQPLKPYLVHHEFQKKKGETIETFHPQIPILTTQKIYHFKSIKRTDINPLLHRFSKQKRSGFLQ